LIWEKRSRKASNPYPQIGTSFESFAVLPLFDSRYRKQLMIEGLRGQGHRERSYLDFESALFEELDQCFFDYLTLSMQAAFDLCGIDLQGFGYRLR